MLAHSDWLPHPWESRKSLIEKLRAEYPGIPRNSLVWLQNFIPMSFVIFKLEVDVSLTLGTYFKQRTAFAGAFCRNLF